MREVAVLIVTTGSLGPMVEKVALSTPHIPPGADVITVPSIVTGAPGATLNEKILASASNVPS